jgi:hypothetical protein
VLPARTAANFGAMTSMRQPPQSARLRVQLAETALR